MECRVDRRVDRQVDHQVDRQVDHLRRLLQVEVLLLQAREQVLVRAPGLEPVRVPVRVPAQKLQ